MLAYFCEIKMNALGVMFIIFLLTMVLALLVNALLRQHKLYSYLKQKHYFVWEKLTSLGSFGPGMRNSIKGILFIFDRNDLGDPLVKEYKRKTRNAFVTLLVCFVLSQIFAFLFAISSAFIKIIIEGEY